MQSQRTRGAGGGQAFLRPRGSRLATTLAVIVAITSGALAGIAGTRSPRPVSSVGRDLGRLHGPRMDPVLAPARVARVVAVPGSADAEAWAYGHTHWRNPGWSQTDPQGQAVFLSYRRGRGWSIEQPLVDPNGNPTSPGVAAFDMVEGGEGYGVGGTGLIFHRPAGGRWQVHPQSGAVATVDLTAISLATDAAGTYGWAVGSGPTFLRLTDGTWQHDLGSVRGAGGTGDILGNVVGVATIDRETAWAVAATPRQLVLYRRNASEGWQRVQTGKPLFDVAPSLHANAGGAPVVNQFATGAAIAAAGRAVWVTGALQPVDGQRYVNQRGPGSDPQRPFALRIDQNGSFTTYCAPVYQLSSGGVTGTNDLCEHPFPFSVGSLPALDGLSNGDVFAGGAGVFRYAAGRWTREPNVAGLVSSLSFGSATEGWVTSFGNRTAEGGSLAASTSPTLGHWTVDAATPSMLRRWPHPSRRTLEGIVLAPDGEAIAVGGGGDIARFEPGVGWDMMPSPTDVALHDAAWPAPGQAWAVGDRGIILRFDGTRWRHDAASRRLTKEALYALAFREANDGIAVGARGTILRWNGSSWRADPAGGKTVDVRLHAVAYVGSETIVVGEKSTILIDGGDGWKQDSTAPERFKTLQEGRIPNLFTVVGLDDGRAFVGGELSILLERVPGGRFERTSSFPVLNGSILTLAATRTNGRLRLLASVATEPSGRVTKYGGSGLIEPTGWLFASDGDTWSASGDQRVAETGTEVDAPVRRDAVYDIAVDASGRGFAVGGYPADLADEDGHLSGAASGSIWRLDTRGMPEPAPNTARVPVRAESGSIGFAFLADTACVSGLCAAASGTGARADEIVARALADVEDAAASGEVRFVTFGGDFRRLGIPDELDVIGRMLDTLPVPSFAAIGDQDLFGGVDAAGESVLASNGYFLSAFADRPAPWGHAPPHPSIRPLSAPGEPVADSTQARTHYAFDYMIDGRPALRMIVLDTSRTAQEIAFQNPQSDQDSAFARPLLAEAAALSIPSMVVMHQPLLASVGTGARTGTLTAALAGTGVNGVLASHERVNRLIAYADPVQPFPVAILGSTGGALNGSWNPEAGAYHAWFHVSVPLDGDAHPRIRSIPVLESVALSAPGGRTAGAGGTLRFLGLGRIPDVGGGHIASGGDPTSDRAQYLSFPFARPCRGPLQNPGNAACTGADVLVPDFEFSCEDRRVCVFVAEDPVRPGTPLINAAGTMEASAASGLMCALRPGSTFVRLRAGVVQTRMPVRVTGGDGACVDRPVVDASAPAVVPASDPRQAPSPVDRDAPPSILKPKSFDAAAIPALAPPPIQPAPAPPGGGAPKYEEEREASVEKAEMTALDPAAMFAAAFALAVGLALRVRPRGRAAPARRTAAPQAYAGAPPDVRRWLRP